ncbi:MAG: Lipopolysaccharide core heptosyltransferase RfaQ [Planctomycetes bacterium ADurb.Bin401]|nr:MAG: Lipopolysaccharide core heptosyltransferase RfaQ [Planctomycetes bacterium ADurb.Bin401]
MAEENDILKLLANAEADADRLSTRALIIQPGAIGDSVLTLPVIEYIKKTFKIGTITILGRSQYMLYLPTRSCIDSIRDLDSIDLHRLFVSSKEFELQDNDSLITAFAGFQHIFTFLGSPDSDFERNLIFTANCSNAVEVTTLAAKPPADYKNHITKYYIDTIVECCGEYISRKPTSANLSLKKKLVKPLKSDPSAGRAILDSFGVKKQDKPVIIHPGSGGTPKCWNIENFYLAAEELIDAGENVVFLIGPAEQERFSRKIIDRLSLVAPVIFEFSLTRTFQLLSSCGCFIGNDSGIGHIAGISGIPTVVCFGPTDPSVYCPVGPKVKTFRFEDADFSQPSSHAVEQVSRAALKLLSS